MNNNTDFTNNIDTNNSLADTNTQQNLQQDSVVNNIPQINQVLADDSTNISPVTPLSMSDDSNFQNQKTQTLQVNENTNTQNTQTIYNDPNQYLNQNYQDNSSFSNSLNSKDIEQVATNLQTQELESSQNINNSNSINPINVNQSSPKQNELNTQFETNVLTKESEGINDDKYFKLTDNNYDNILQALVDMGAISSDVAEKIQKQADLYLKDPEDIIKQQRLVNEEDLYKAKALVDGIPFINIAETSIDPEALSIISQPIARKYNLIPFKYDDENKEIHVAMKDPMDLAAKSFLEQRTGLTVKTYYAIPSLIDRAIEERYSQNISSDVNEAVEENKIYKSGPRISDRLRRVKVLREDPITRIFSTIMNFAIRYDASDIHIEPQVDKTRVRYRIDGILYEKLVLPKSVHENVVSKIKILSKLKIDEKRLPQDGRFDYSYQGKEVDLRVSTLPTIHGEKVVMRLLPKNRKIPTLPELGLRGLGLTLVNEAIVKPHGIILITGPTGSGKTTTLYSILHKINTPKVNIMTLENPVEYEMPGISQVQINEQAGLTFASGLRSFLRQDPDIMMVGEIRDRETAALAVEASLTGHLVFSTLHTNSAAGALPRLIDMGVEPFLLSSSMTLVMAQRVVRRINPKYKEDFKPSKEVIDDIKEVLGDLFDKYLKEKGISEDEIILKKPARNRPPNEPEYKGRIGIFEVMKINDELIKLINKERPAVELEKVAIENGMTLMKQDGYLRVLEGITTVEEVLRVAQT